MSRADHEGIVAGLAELVRYERDQNLAAARHYAELLEKYHALRAAGAAIPTPTIPLQQKDRDDVLDAIELQAGNDRGLSRELQRWAKRQQLNGVSDVEIVKSIMHWEDPDDFDDIGLIPLAPDVS